MNSLPTCAWEKRVPVLLEKRTRINGKNVRFGNGGKSLFASDNHIVIAAGTMDDENFAVFVPASHDTYVLVIGIKHEISDPRWARHGMICWSSGRIWFAD